MINDSKPIETEFQKNNLIDGHFSRLRNFASNLFKQSFFILIFIVKV